MDFPAYTPELLAAALFGSIAIPILTGVRFCINELFAWLGLLIERQKIRAERKNRELREDDL